MQAPLEISVRGLGKRYGGSTILSDIHFNVASGETVALIGPSGGGKSTLLRCLNGLGDFDEGEVNVGPHALRPGDRGAAAQVRQLLGMVFQDFQLFPHLTAIENVMEAPRQVLKLARAQAMELALEMLSKVGLRERAAAYPRQLSGGQKQRVAIARALAMSPRGLLCDEITSALDPELKCEVLAVLEDLKKAGMTLIMVTHEIGFARRAADRILVLEGGRILEQGTPAQVIDSPQTERMRLFLSRVLG